MAPIVISIEGGIAIGKSTLCEKLEECGYKVFKEGLDEWGDVLDLFYKDPKRNCYLLQTAILMNMYNQKQYINSLKDDIVFIERCPLSALHIFVENSRNSNLLSDIEHKLYKKLHNKLGWCPDYIIGLTLNPDVAFERLKKRDRKCERNTSVEYITQVSNLYDKTFKKWKSYIKNRRLTVKGIITVDAIDSENIILIKVMRYINEIRKLNFK